jgi:heat shock protein HtpX
MTNTFRTWTLLAALAALLIFAGGLLAGQQGMIIALLFAVAMNGFVYWKSDTLALKANGARELREGEAPRLRSTVQDLAQRAGIPAPRVYIVDRPEPNAFATGRNPQHAAVAVTTGLLQAMDERQVRGVLAHELSHVKNRDTLVGTIAATIGGAISFLAQMAQFQLLFGGRRDGGAAQLIGAIAAIILAPMAAMIIQFAVSRGREYMADSTGARLTGDPEGLAQALERLGAANRHGIGGPGRRREAQSQMNPAFAHLYIVNPLSGGNVRKLFSTHPPIEERVNRLRSLRYREG